jgi:transcriptional regulator NrdR family protein
MDASPSAAGAFAPIAVAASPPLNACSCAILVVVKKSGRKAPFDRDKLLRSVEIALRKRNVDPDRIDRAVTGIVRQLESSGERKSPQRRLAVW